jgi:hypothetical protein
MARLAGQQMKMKMKRAASRGAVWQSMQRGVGVAVGNAAVAIAIVWQSGRARAGWQVSSYLRATAGPVPEHARRER